MFTTTLGPVHISRSVPTRDFVWAAFTQFLLSRKSQPMGIIIAGISLIKSQGHNAVPKDRTHGGP